MTRKKNIIKTFSSTMISSVIVLAFAPLLSRLYHPSSFAEFAIWISFISVLCPILNLRFPEAVVVAPNDRVAFTTACLSLISSWLFSVPASLLFLLLLSTFTIKNYIIAFLIFSFQASILVLLQMQVRMKNFTNFSIITLCSSLSVLFFQIVLHKNSYLQNGLILGYLVGGGLTFILAFYLSFKWLILPKNRFDLLSIKNLTKNFIKYSIPFSLISSFRAKAPYLLLGNFNPHLIAYFSQSEKILNAPSSFLGSALRPVFFAEFSKRRTEQAEKTITSILLFLTHAGTPLVSLLFFFSKDFVAIFFGPQWIQMHLVFCALVFPAFMLSITNWLDRFFDILGSQKTVFILEGVFTILTTLFCSIFLYRLIDETTFVVLFSTLTTVFYVFWLFFLYSKAKFNRKDVFRIITWTIIIFSTSSLILLTLNQVNSSNLLKLCIGLFLYFIYIFINPVTNSMFFKIFKLK